MAKINKTIIGDGYPCYITFEIGPTHNGLDSAKRLIKHASDAGANAVKFQISDPDREVSDKKQMFSYGILKNRKQAKLKLWKSHYTICLNDALYQMNNGLS